MAFKNRKDAQKARKSESKAKAAKKHAAKVTRELIASDAKIKVLVKENPHRGKVAKRTFAQYRNGLTVGAWREAVRKVHGDLGYLHGDIRRGTIAVSNAKH